MNRGAQNLYFKLCRAIANAMCDGCDSDAKGKVVSFIHDRFKKRNNGGKSTKPLGKTEFHNYYLQCQKDSIEMFGVSGMDEDDGEFDHGFPNKE